MKIYLKLTLVLLLAALGANSQTIPKWKLQDLKTAVAEAKKPTVFNFWATFCKPCIEEIPYFQEMAKKYEAQGVQLVLVNLDARAVYPARLQQFVAKRKIKAPVVFLDETDADIFCPAVDQGWSGVIPASLFVNPQTGYRKFYEEQLSKKELETEIRSMIGL